MDKNELLIEHLTYYLNTRKESFNGIIHESLDEKLKYLIETHIFEIDNILKFIKSYSSGSDNSYEQTSYESSYDQS